MKLHITCDRSVMNWDLICTELGKTHWGKARPPGIVLKASENSLCFALFDDTEQVAFARVVTDLTVFAYLMDVVVFEPSRGRGFAKVLMREILARPKLQDLKWLLCTSTAHELYKKFNFRALTSPDTYLERPL